MNVESVIDAVIYGGWFAGGFIAGIVLLYSRDKYGERLKERQEETIEDLRERLANLDPEEHEMDVVLKSRAFWRDSAVRFMRAFKQISAVTRNTEHACSSIDERIEWDADNDVPEILDGMIESDDRAKDMYYAKDSWRGCAE